MGERMSGLATAINLLDLGVEVELIETDELFGGRASSWMDEDGDMIDNALHVFFPYYVNLINFFKKMEICENIIWRKPGFSYMLSGGGRGDVALSRTSIPAPRRRGVSFPA
jgi:uncharacterized protein with NAD-binding domain and iron-sulfur cluster